MMRRILLAAILAAATASAAVSGPRQFTNGEAVTVDPAQGYVLVRMMERPGGMLRGTVKYMPILIRVLSTEEINRANAASKDDPAGWMDKMEPNVVEPLADRAYAKENNQTVLLMPLKPGVYVLGGVALSNWASTSEGGVASSLCLGTVSFEVKPGVITDMGFIVSASDFEATDIPELAKQVTGKRLVMQQADAVAIRPAAPDQVMPEKLRGLAVAPADYHAAGAFPNYLGAPLTRLAPLKGVLDYDQDGQVIDLKAKPAP